MTTNVLKPPDGATARETEVLRLHNIPTPLLVYYCDTSLLCVWRQCHDKSCMTSAIEMSDICMQANAASGLSGPVGGNMSCVLGCRWQDMVTLRGI